MAEFRIAVLAGDGIGPEVTAEAVRVLEAVGRRFGHRFRFDRADVGGCAIERRGTPLPEETVALCQGSEAVLLGAVGGPRWDHLRGSMRPEAGLLGLRKAMGVFANLRPARTFPSLRGHSPLRAEMAQEVDLLVVRELTGGLYFGEPRGRWPLEGGQGERAVDTLVYTTGEIERVARVAFRLASVRRRRLVSVDKANVLESSRLWRETVNRVAGEFPEVALEHLYVDNCAMQLVRQPGRFDVLVTENLFGDILSDEAAVLTGSLGMLPSASLAGPPGETGGRPGLFEPVHGSAPDIAGRGIANPLGAILTAAMLLEHGLGLREEGRAVAGAVDQALTEGWRTADIAAAAERAATTAEVGRRVAELVAEGAVC